VKPTIAFYFRISVDDAMKRIVGGRDALKYYEAGMDRQLSPDIEESFRLFQGAVVEEYDRMIEEFGFVVIDATRSIEEQQVQMREIVTKTLTGARKTRIRRWVDLSSMARDSRPLQPAS
jgi:dTMP kinase